MKRLFLYMIFFLGGLFLFLRYLASKEEGEIKRMKAHPLVYSYYKYSSGVSFSFVARDRECMAKIKNYYDEIKNGKEPYIPACFEHGINFNDSVYVLAFEKDSALAKVAVFYKDPKGKEKHFVGYILAETLHSDPYKE